MKVMAEGKVEFRLWGFIEIKNASPCSVDNMETKAIIANFIFRKSLIIIIKLSFKLEFTAN